MVRARVLAIALIAALALAAPGAFAQTAVTVKILAGQSTTDAGIENFISDAVSAKYPEVKLDWEVVGWPDLPAKIQEYMKSGLPDIIVGKGQDIATFASRNILGSISGKPYLKNVVAAAVGSGSYKGKDYGIVYNALYQGVYYNRKLFKDNGIAVPRTQAELKAVIDKFKSLGITPFETHFVDLWSIGNITMQFMINDVFNKTPDWGDRFRAGKAGFASSPIAKTVFGYDKLIYDNTWKDETFSLQQTNADGRLVQGKAAMKVSGSWSIQNFLDVDPGFDFGIFPFPNQTGDAKLIFEPNITFMKSATTDKSDAIDKVFTVLTTDKDLGQKIFDQTKTASTIKGIGPTFNNPSQKDIDVYVAKNQIVDANSGNLQLVWGGFQDENAKDIAAWLQGTETLDQALQAADSRRANSKP